MQNRKRRRQTAAADQPARPSKAAGVKKVKIERPPVEQQFYQRVLQHRGSRRTWVGVGGTGANEDTESICRGYDAEGYGSMNMDMIRNRVYGQAIKTVPTIGKHGCGSRARGHR